MILSVSRRTDIPAFYAEWFYNRIREGYVLVRNPFNYHQLSRIPVTPDLVDCIVFWSKNPAPLMPRLGEIDQDYPFYFQFTVNDYGKEMEPNVPPLDERLETFRVLSKRYGKERVIWRYDPLILTENYDVKWHLQRFKQLAGELAGYTERCVFSFVDIYGKIKSNMEKTGYLPITLAEQEEVAGVFSETAAQNGMDLRSCAEEIDLAAFGIKHSSCIDGELIERIIGCPLDVKKDGTQREQCQCVESIDLGQYNTCKHACRYCYANFNLGGVEKSYMTHDPESPLLVGRPELMDKITDRKVKSLRKEQISLF